MAAIQYLESTPVTTEESHTGDNDWTDIPGATLSGFTGSKKYLIIVNALIGGNANTGEFQFKMLHASTDFASSFRHIEPNLTSGALNNYSWWTVFEQTATPETVKMQFRIDSASSGTIFADEIRIFAINLTDDLTEDTGSGGDWKFAEDTSGPTQHTTTPVDRVSLVFTPNTADEDWLILARAEVIVNATSINYEMHLLEDGSDARKQLSKEGEDTTENDPMTMVYVAESLSAASHTYKVQTEDDASGANDYDTSALFALRLDAFESHSVIQTPGVFEPGSTGFEEIATVTHTPTTTGDHLIIGDMLSDSGIVNCSLRLQFGGTSDPTGWEDSVSQIDPNDVDDQYNAPLFVIRSIPDTGVAIDLDAKGTTASDFYDRTIVAFSMELDAAAGQFLRPDSDIDAAGWTPTPSSPTTLFDKIDEVTASDTDYISET